MRYKKRKTENGKPILFFIWTVLIAAAIYFIYFTFTVFMSRSSGVSDSGGFRLYFMARDLEEVAGAGALCEISCDLTPDENRSPDETARMLLEALLNGPKDDDLRSPFPVGTVARSLELRGSRAVADFSEPYGSLSGVALTLADSAVTLTLTQIPEISLVEIRVEGQTIAYREKQSFTARDILLLPDGDVVGSIQVRLSFPNASGELIEEERVLFLYEGDTQVEAVARAVENGPESRDLLPAFPEGFRIRSARLEEDICFVNLSSALLDSIPGDALSLGLYALDRSLCSLKNVRETRYLIDGEFMTDYNGVTLTEPYNINIIEIDGESDNPGE